MLKKLVWELSAMVAGKSFAGEYRNALKSNSQVFLENLLFSAYNNVPYYRNILKNAGVVKDKRLLLTNFDRIPILTKETIRRKEIYLISRDNKRREWFYNTSSGSTGEPLRFIQDRSFLKWGHATSKYYYKIILGVDEAFSRKILLWAARDLFRPSLRLRENAARTIYNAFTNTMVLDCTYMTEADMERYVKAINSYKPKIIRGYANALYEICRFVEKRSLAIRTPTILISSAEMLRDDVRKKIETVFGTKVYDVYGSREVGGIAGECRHGLLHMFMFNNYVEIVDRKGNRVKKGEDGKVIVTTLHNYSMPFIRYDIGDMAILGPEKCNCGNPLPTLRKITGRTCCFFRKRDGTLIDDGYFMGIFAQEGLIKSFRVIQEDYAKIRVIVALKEKAKDFDKRSIEKKIRSVMGEDCSLKWEVVDEIPKANTAKYLYTQSLVSE